MTYLRRLSLRLWTLHGVRALCASAGALAATLLLSSRFSAPVLTASSALSIWAAGLVVAGATFALTIRGLRRYRGAGITRLFEPGLASRVRSALELEHVRTHTGSQELVAAHLAQVEAAMIGVPQQRLVPVSGLRHVSVVLGLSALLAAIAVVLVDPRMASFARGLVRPAAVTADGTRIAPIVERMRVRVTFPSYMGKAPEQLVDPERIAVPAGATLELHIETTLPAERGVLLGGSREVQLTRAHDGRLVGKWSASESAHLRVRMTSDGVRYEDPRTRELSVLADRVPSIALLQPKNGAFVPPDAVIQLLLRASDDVGVAAVDLYVRLPGGEERHRRIWSALDHGVRKELDAGSQLVLSELGVREGDNITLWLEARDEDPVSGPNAGKSDEVTIEITSEARRMAAFIPDLQAVADSAVELLGDRLELPVPEDAPQASARFAAIEKVTVAWLEQMGALLSAQSEPQDGLPMDADQVRGIKRRNQKLLNGERALHTGSVRSLRERARADTQTVSELERDVILLVDLLAKVHVDEASAIAEELRDLKQRIEHLLAQAGKTQSPEDKRALLAEIARAEQRLAQLSRSLSRMATRVPSEFVNREAMRSKEAGSTLEDLENAVASDDLEAAAKHLDALAKQIDDLTAQLGEGGIRMQRERFGPRDQAMAAARQQLDMLAAEQERLAGRSSDALPGLHDRPQDESGAARARGLAPQVDAIEQTLDRMDDRAQQGWQSQRLDRARQRLSDTQAALQSGDLAQARGMAQQAQHGLAQAASELESEARMFPGHQGETARNAEHARRAAEQAQKLSEAIGRGLPAADPQLSPGKREQLAQDAAPQRATREQAGKLREHFERGPDGLPLSPEAVDQLQAAEQDMQQAERALEGGRVQEAAQAQGQASERLGQLAKKLAQEGQGGRGSRGQQSRADGGANAEGPVRIPGEDDWQGPTQMRRKLLDAMREAAPTGFEAAVQRYYQELLR